MKRCYARSKNHTKYPTTRLVGLMAALCTTATFGLPSAKAAGTPNAYEAGYLIVPIPGRVSLTYDQGFSLYVPAWPLLSFYPGRQFQSGLPGTWMFAQHRQKAPKPVYSDVEGGLGWWRDTRFATITPKFTMGGVGPNFTEVAQGPGAGAGTWKHPMGKYGVAQLSPWLLFPPDGLNIRQGASGGLVGYGYLNLPLLGGPGTVGEEHIPTRNHCWTLFLNTGNFKGPVAFFTPYYWAHFGKKYPDLVGHLLDSKPAQPNRAVQMETQYIPCQVAQDSAGNWWARVAPTRFPLNDGMSSALVHRDTVYNKSALWNAVNSWFSGGPSASGAIDPAGALQRPMAQHGYSTWEIRMPAGNGKWTKAPVAWNMFATPALLGPHTYGYRWLKGIVKEGRGKNALVTLPQYYRLESASNRQPSRWVPVPKSTVPSETHLQEIVWRTPRQAPSRPFITPTAPDSSWKSPGPAAGPYTARLGDGTVLTYYWYKFDQQPAIMHAGLTTDQRHALQLRVEKLQRNWTRNRNYLQAPGFGRLADVDPALIVNPPRRLGVGYVPIVTAQNRPVKR